MSGSELEVLKMVFVTTVVSFYLIALPLYFLMRKRSPEAGWNLEGNVSVSAIRPWDLLVMGLYILIFSGFLVALEKMGGRQMGEGEVTAGKVLGSSFTMLCLASLVPAALFWRVNLVEFLGLRWRAWVHVFWIMPTFVFGILSIAAVSVSLGWQTWVEQAFNSEQQDVVQMIRDASDPWLLVAMAFSAVIVAPIAEELIFRGFLYPVVKRFTDRWFAAVFTGVFFGVIHFNLYSFPIIAIMGIILAVIYEKTGSLWSVIGCHAAFNGLQVGLMILMKFVDLPIEAS